MHSGAKFLKCTQTHSGKKVWKYAKMHSDAKVRKCAQTNNGLKVKKHKNILLIKFQPAFELIAFWP